METDRIGTTTRVCITGFLKETTSLPGEARGSGMNPRLKSHAVKEAGHVTPTSTWCFS